MQTDDYKVEVHRNQPTYSTLLRLRNEYNNLHALNSLLWSIVLYIGCYLLDDVICKAFVDQMNIYNNSGMKGIN